MVAPSVCPKGYRLPPGIALVLGVLIGLSLLPVLKSLFGAQLFSCTCVSLCPNSPRNLTAAAQSAAGGEAGPFSSFIYPTWPSTELSPAVRSRQGRQPGGGQAAQGAAHCVPVLASFRTRHTCCSPACLAARLPTCPLQPGLGAGLHPSSPQVQEAGCG